MSNNFIRFWAQSIKGLFTHPLQFLASVEETGSRYHAFKFIALSSALGGLLTGLVRGILMSAGGAPFSLAGPTVLIGLIIGTVVGFIGTVANALIIHLAVLMFGRTGYTRTLEGICYSSASFAVLGWIAVHLSAVAQSALSAGFAIVAFIAIAGQLFGLAYTLFLSVSGLMQFQNLSTGKALVAAFLWPLVFGGILVILILPIAVASA